MRLLFGLLLLTLLAVAGCDPRPPGPDLGPCPVPPCPCPDGGPCPCPDDKCPCPAPKREAREEFARLPDGATPEAAGCRAYHCPRPWGFCRRCHPRGGVIGED